MHVIIEGSEMIPFRLTVNLQGIAGLYLGLELYLPQNLSRF